MPAVARNGQIPQKFFAMVSLSQLLSVAVFSRGCIISQLTEHPCEWWYPMEQPMSQAKISARILMPVLATALSAGMSGDASATAQESALGAPLDPAMMKLGDESAPPARSAPLAERPNEGLMIADVIARGVHQLDGPELKRFIAGKTMIVRNTVTGHRYEVFYAADGNCVVRPSMGRRREAEPVRAISNTDAPGLPSRYAVTADGKLRTMLDGRSFTVKIYKNGSTYLAIENEDFDQPTQR